MTSPLKAGRYSAYVPGKQIGSVYLLATYKGVLLQSPGIKLNTVVICSMLVEKVITPLVQSIMVQDTVAK
jgi:hypothetical protein